MTARGANVLRIATFVVFGLVVLVLFYRLATGPGDDVETVDVGTGELTVADAVALAPTEAVTVRGYVFLGPGSGPLRLCDGVVEGDPPQCLGPYLSLEGGVNEGSFNFREGDDAGRPVRWVPEPIAVHGRIRGTVLRVEQILN